ncbi:MAG TPA: nitroreductase family protein [Nitrospiraceae bacterium]|jgi:nitroreductase|nr:nitroreductase family protein [Nitrospiraceae bacterium]
MMEKPADTQYPIHDLLRQRWSPRAFDDRSIEPEKLLSLCEAARWAPSSNNEQPWRFIVANKDYETEWNRLLACLVEGNRKWAYRAPVLILSVASLNFEDDSTPNRHAFHDTGMAVENLVLQATALGLSAHQMAGFDVEKARADLKIPSGYEPVAMIAVGYPGDLASLPDRLRQRELQPRSRRPISEWTFSGQWGEPLR